MWTLALIALLASSTNLAGPAGLARGLPWQYVMKMVLGALIGFGLLAPLILGDARHRWLESRVAATIGRWSYGIFIWHLAVLSVVFQIFGLIPFRGMFPRVLILTVLFTVPNQLGVAYNARILSTIARDIAPAIGWSPARASAGI